MITKKTFPVGEVQIVRGEKVFDIKKMVAEYRIFGILLLRKELITPSGVAGNVVDYNGYTPKF